MNTPKISEDVNEKQLIAEVSRIISDITGIQLGDKQFALVQGRLAKRMRELRVETPSDYARHLNANYGIEVGVLTSLLTTHHTYFFREFVHFEYLLKNTLPGVIAEHRAKGENTIRIWSAACSRGQEVYSLSMFLHHHLPTIAPDMKFEIVGSDVCEESIAIAKNGVYTWDEIKAVPAVYLQGNWMRGTGDISNFVRAKERLRENIKFQVINLQELDRHPLGVGVKFDVIFCRNVFIYFDPKQIESISSEFTKLLSPQGHLYIGVSESLSGLDVPVEWIGPSVYLSNRAKGLNPAPKLSSSADQASRSKGVGAPVRTPIAEVPRLRILCVDDSPTVLTLLKKILTREKGFEVVGTAANGLEAAAKARELRPDAITLDIHMPEMNGVEFLERHYSELKIPVVMVSSVSREDSTLAFRALELGAADYVEKPSLQNLEKVEEELQFKLRAAAENYKRDGGRSLSLDASFRRAPLILKPEGKLRVLIAPFSARDEVLKLLHGFRAPQPPTLVLIEGAPKELFADWMRRASEKVSGGRAGLPSSAGELLKNSVTFADFDDGAAFIRMGSKGLRLSTLVMGVISPNLARKVMALPATHLIVEDRGQQTSVDLARRAQQIVPLTSFTYESDKYFAEISEAA